MTRPTRELIEALRTTARRLDQGAHYQWTHMGSCNCGHLAQTLTKLTRAQLHAFALEKAGDWGEQAIEYCPSSNYPIDVVLAAMFDAGLSRSDIVELERLSSPRVLARLPEGSRTLVRSDRSHVVLYMRAFADLLEEELPREPETIAAKALDRVA
jgi:hypothetical protein